MSCNDWKEAKLGETLQNKGYIRGPFGSALKRGDMIDCGIPVYEQANAIYDHRNFRFYISDFKFEEMKRFQVQTDDLIISCSGTVGRVSIIKKNDAKGIISQALLILRVNKQLMLPIYLKYFFVSAEGYNAIISRSIGSVQVNISKRNIIEQIPLSLPPLPEQKAIADTLSCLDDKIELNNKINKNLEAQAQAIFKSWFVDFEPFQDGEFVDSELGRIPKGWEVGTLGEVAEFQNGYAFKSKDLLKATTANCYDVFKMGHIKKGGGFYTDGTKSWILKERCKALNKYVLKKGDLLMCMTDMKGNVALLGHTALMNTDNKYIVNQRVGLLRPNGQHNIGFPYLYLLTNNSEFIENLRNRANSGVQVNLSSNEIKISKLFIPPNDLNTKFNEISMLLFETIFEKENEIKNLTALRDTLLPKLMSGEIRVPVEVE